ncbi:MAG: SIS domain-containing protein [Armatimonadota bacterium]
MSTEQPTPILDDLAGMQAVDKRNMLRLVRELPEQCETALGIGRSLPIEPLTFTPNVVFITGVGDSGLAADMVVEAVCEDIAVPIFSDHGGRLPKYIGEESLVFVIDYTGKSGAALSNYREAKLKGATVIVITSGGKLNAAAAKDGTRVVKIPPGQPARSSIGYLFVPIVAILEKLELMTGQIEKLTYGIRLLKNVRESLRDEVPQARNIAKQTAQTIMGRFAVILGGTGYRSVVTERFKTQINSNAKSAACAESFPDIAAGAISGWELAQQQCKDVVFIFLRDAVDKSEIADQMNAARDVLSGCNTVELVMKGSTNIEKLLYGAYLADYVSCYLAFLYGVDPSANEFVTQLESRIAGEELPEQP